MFPILFWSYTLYKPLWVWVVKKGGMQLVMCLFPAEGEQDDLLIMHGCCLITNLQATASFSSDLLFFLFLFFLNLCKGTICIPFINWGLQCTGWQAGVVYTGTQSNMNINGTPSAVWSCHCAGYAIRKGSGRDLKKKTLQQTDGGYRWYHA